MPGYGQRLHVDRAQPAVGGDLQRRGRPPSARGPCRRSGPAGSACARGGRRGSSARRRRRPPRPGTWRPGCGRARCGGRPAAARRARRRARPPSTCRCPVMSAPIATSIWHRSTTSGSRAALSIVVTPSANTAAVTMFSVAPTLGNGERDVGAVQPVGGRLDLAVAELERRAHRLQPGDVHVDRPGAEVVAAGHRQAHPAAAGEQRAEHVDRRPDALDELVRARPASRSPSLRRRSTPGDRRPTTADADRLQQLAEDRHVDDRRHVRQLVLAVGEDRRRHQLEHGVLGARARRSCRAARRRAAHEDLATGSRVGAACRHR